MSQMPSFGSRTRALLVPLAFLATGITIGMFLGRGPRAVSAVASLADESFAVCTAPIEGGFEGIFVLDFETGDLSGGLLNQNTSKFGAGYRHNVLPDLGFKAGRVKKPRFMLVAGMANLGAGGNGQFAQSVLYVTDVSTGVTVAYGIPAPVAGQPQRLQPLDVARPRGGGDKAP